MPLVPLAGAGPVQQLASRFTTTCLRSGGGQLRCWGGGYDSPNNGYDPHAPSSPVAPLVVGGHKLSKVHVRPGLSFLFALSEASCYRVTMPSPGLDGAGHGDSSSRLEDAQWFSYEGLARRSMCD